jgi:beta-mannosidase
MHFWSVWHEGKSFSAYHEVRPRFCSEFGFQSLPSPRIARSFASGEGLNATSPVFEHHQRHPRGNTIILETMSRYFRMPTGFYETLWLSQVQQAMAIHTAVEYWRSDQPRCMGTLYWQLNDVWPAASWSSLDYDGGWKLLHYEARRFFDPVLLALYVKDGIVQAWAVNDQDRALQGRAAIQLQRFDGSPLMNHGIDIELPAGSSTLVWKAHLDELPARPDEAFLTAHIDLGGEQKITRYNQLFLSEPKRCFPIDPQLASSLGEDADGPFLRIESRYPAFWVTPQVEDLPGRWDDAGFPMAASEVRTLRYIPATGAPMPTAEALGQATRIMHLRASYA